MLIINGHRESCIPIGYFGGVIYSDIQPNWYRPWSWQNIYVGDAGFPKQTSIPDGNYHPVVWFWPMTGGNITARYKLVGTGSISALGNLGMEASAALTGSGGISDALGTLIVNLAASLTGSGTISNADLKAFLQAVAALSGSGGITEGELLGVGELIADLVGAGVIDATFIGTGAMSADITATGGVLTAQEVANAVWAAIAAANNESGSMGEKLNSAASAGDPWITELPGSYTGEQAGNIMGTKLLTLAKFLGLK